MFLALPGRFAPKWRHLSFVFVLYSMAGKAQDLTLTTGTTNITSSATYVNALIENDGTVLDIDNNSTLTINGDFMLRSEAIVYVRAGSSLILNGTDTIQRATMEVFGTLRAENSGTEVGSGWDNQPISHLIIHPTGEAYLLDLMINSGGNNGAGPPAEVDVYGTLVVAQNLEVSSAGDQAELNVYTTGNVTVGGDLTNGGSEPGGTSPTDENAQILIDGGVLHVLGDAYNHRQVIIDNDGQFIIGGNYENVPNPDDQTNLYTEVGGTLSVGGSITNNGTLQFNSTECGESGSGSVEWGTTFDGTGDVEDATGTHTMTSSSPGSYDLCTGTLPVTWTYFEAQVVDEKVLLSWQTATEISNDFFKVERSSDGMVWEQVAEIEGAGNSAELISYDCWDHTPYYGHSYYRLLQTDYDGTTTFNSAQQVTLVPSVSSMKVYPNPASDQIILENGGNRGLSIEMFNLSGRQIQIPLRVQQSRVLVDLASVPQGIYFLRVSRPGFSHSQKIVVK